MENFIELLIESILELTLGKGKSTPKKIPQAEYKSEFTIRANKTAIWIALVLSVLVSAAISTIAYIGNGIPFALLFLICGLVIACLFVYALGFECLVTEEKIIQTSLFFFKKTIYWNDILCIIINKNRDDSSKNILLYNNNKKCVMDFLESFENIGCIIKMAEQKRIEIREEKGLSLKQMRKIK